MLLTTRSQILDLNIEAQPDDVTCGPTCLHALYSYYGDHLALNQVISEIKQLQAGGTLAVQLANHALLRGYNAKIYTYNLHIFDPSWFNTKTDLSAKLFKQLKHKREDLKLVEASHAYLTFLERGGTIKFEELTPKLIKNYLSKKIPILTGLSATYLYESCREIGDEVVVFDDLKGIPAGHFVVINGYDANSKHVFLADPLDKNPISAKQNYKVKFKKLINSILLGVMTYDANLLIIYPK